MTNSRHAHRVVGPSLGPFRSAFRLEFGSLSPNRLVFQDRPRRFTVFLERIDARHSEVTEHDCVLGARYAIEQLVWLKRMTAESAGRIEPRTGNGWKSLFHLHDPASRWSPEPTWSPSPKVPLSQAGCSSPAMIT